MPANRSPKHVNVESIREPALRRVVEHIYEQIRALWSRLDNPTAPAQSQTSQQPILGQRARAEEVQTVPATRRVHTTFPLTGGGDLSADRTVRLAYRPRNLMVNNRLLDTVQDICITATFQVRSLTANNSTEFVWPGGTVKQVVCNDTDGKQLYLGPTGLFASADGAVVGDTYARRIAAGVLEISALQVAGNIGFYGTTPQPKPTITGSKGGNEALADLLAKLQALGLITDSTT